MKEHKEYYTMMRFNVSTIISLLIVSIHRVHWGLRRGLTFGNTCLSISFEDFKPLCRMLLMFHRFSQRLTV